MYAHIANSKLRQVLKFELYAAWMNITAEFYGLQINSKWTAYIIDPYNIHSGGEIKSVVYPNQVYMPSLHNLVGESNEGKSISFAEFVLLE